MLINRDTDISVYILGVNKRWSQVVLVSRESPLRLENYALHNLHRVLTITVLFLKTRLSPASFLYFRSVLSNKGVILKQTNVNSFHLVTGIVCS